MCDDGAEVARVLEDVVAVVEWVQFVEDLPGIVADEDPDGAGPGGAGPDGAGPGGAGRGGAGPDGAGPGAPP